MGVDYCENVQGNAKLPGIMAIGYIAAFSETLALAVIVSKGVAPLRDALTSEPEDQSQTCIESSSFQMHPLAGVAATSQRRPDQSTKVCPQAIRGHASQRLGSSSCICSKWWPAVLAGARRNCWWQTQRVHSADQQLLPSRNCGILLAQLFQDSVGKDRRVPARCVITQLCAWVKVTMIGFVLCGATSFMHGLTEKEQGPLI